MTWHDLAARVGLSITPTMRRVRIMEQAGIIQGYTVLVDTDKMLGSMTAMIGITLDKQVRSVLELFEAHVAMMSEVVFGALMSGDQDYMLKVLVRDLDHYRDLLSRLTEIDGVAHIHSSFVLKLFVDRLTPIPE